jgi:energy-coupling factor transport system permease protein
VNVAPRYLGRGSWLARRDPRVLVLAVILFIFGAIQVWDGRVVLALFVVAFLYYRSAGIPWREVWRSWLFVSVFLLLLLLFNTFLTGGVVGGFRREDLHVFMTVPLLGTPISAESVSYAATQFVRALAMVAIGFPVAFAIAPSDFGVTFAGLRLHYKFAYAVDLTFRFLPSLAADLQTTLDAQRIRGLDDQAGGNPVARLRRMAPVIVPLTVNAIAGAEDTIDAMDLRGFGTGPRTWLRHLVFARTDKVLIAAFAALAIGLTIAGFVSTTSRVWVPEFLIELAAGR